MNMELTYINDDGNEETMTLPSKMEVCDDCGGTGFVLCEGMRGHAYSAEEFYEEFDPEEQEAYFTRGGMYDEQCPTCKGKNVVPVVDESVLTPEQKTFYDAYCEYKYQCASNDRADAMTRRAECGYY